MTAALKEVQAARSLKNERDSQFCVADDHVHRVSPYFRILGIADSQWTHPLAGTVMNPFIQHDIAENSEKHSPFELSVRTDDAAIGSPSNQSISAFPCLK
jgi:hypothetical protein